MLKKLVKYGNSNALILDRAILELLNIKEGAIVKLETDGKALMITPQEPVKEESVFIMDGAEKLQHSLTSDVEKQMADIRADVDKSQQFDEWKQGSENFEKLSSLFKEIMEKYKDDFALLQSDSFLAELDKLAEKHDGDRSSAGFLSDVVGLRIKHVPRLADMDREMLAAKKSLGMPDYL